jgi:hypothetical protein
MLKWLIAVIVLYAGFVALLYVAQRSLQYSPERRRTAPRAIGLPEAEEAVLDTTDGERVIVYTRTQPEHLLAGLACHKKEPQAVYAPWGLSLLPQLRLLYPAAGASGDVSRSVESYYFRY